MAQYRHLLYLPPHYSQRGRGGDHSLGISLLSPLEAWNLPGAEHVSAGRRQASRLSTFTNTQWHTPDQAGSVSVSFTAMTPTQNSARCVVDMQFMFVEQ